jgi:hypothetical protein
MGQRQVEKMLAGDSLGSLGSCLMLANALDVTMEELFRPDAHPTNAREPRARYRIHQPAADAQLETLQVLARRLDAKTLDALIHFARHRRK